METLMAKNDPEEWANGRRTLSPRHLSLFGVTLITTVILYGSTPANFRAELIGIATAIALYNLVSSLREQVIVERHMEEGAVQRTRHTPPVISDLLVIPVSMLIGCFAWFFLGS